MILELLATFCVEFAGQCERGAARVPVSEAVAASAVQAVRSSWTKRRDAEGRDHWSIGDTGDCEDFALSVRAALPRGASELLFGTAANGEGHAVLMIHTNNGPRYADLIGEQLELSRGFTWTLAYSFEVDEFRINGVTRK